MSKKSKALQKHIDTIEVSMSSDKLGLHYFILPHATHVHCVSSSLCSFASLCSFPSFHPPHPLFPFSSHSYYHGGVSLSPSSWKLQTHKQHNKPQKYNVLLRIHAHDCLMCSVPLVWCLDFSSSPFFTPISLQTPGRVRSQRPKRREPKIKRKSGRKSYVNRG